MADRTQLRGQEAADLLLRTLLHHEPLPSEEGVDLLPERGRVRRLSLVPREGRRYSVAILAPDPLRIPDTIAPGREVERIYGSPMLAVTREGSDRVIAPYGDRLWQEPVISRWVEALARRLAPAPSRPPTIARVRQWALRHAASCELAQHEVEVDDFAISLPASGMPVGRAWIRTPLDDGGGAPCVSDGPTARASSWQESLRSEAEVAAALDVLALGGGPADLDSAIRLARGAS